MKVMVQFYFPPIFAYYGSIEEAYYFDFLIPFMWSDFAFALGIHVLVIFFFIIYPRALCALWMKLG